MKVCADCFVDEELKGFINAQNNTEICDCLGVKAPIIDTKELEDFLVDILNLYEPDENGKVLAVRLFEDTRVFARLEYVWEIGRAHV